jgi:NhaP-type Na+/H+ or K+/H+ antiporter
MDKVLKIAGIVTLVATGLFIGWVFDNRRNYAKIKTILDNTEEKIGKRFQGFIKK